MFRLLAQKNGQWTAVAELVFGFGKSTIQHGLLTGEVSLVINSDYCVVGDIKDLRQLNLHISTTLGSSLEAQVKTLGEGHGFGVVMQETSKQWQAKSDATGFAGQGFVMGPHKKFTVECGCDQAPGCEWCCGCGWVTEHVKALKGD